MSTHTTYFCDWCNQDREASQGQDDGHAVTYTESPTLDGWAEFNSKYAGYGGREMTEEIHICAHCLADPEFEPKGKWWIPEWDDYSTKNFHRGRAHAERFAWALENLGERERWHRRGVWQVFGHAPYGYQVGPRMADGRFNTTDKVKV